MGTIMHKGLLGMSQSPQIGSSLLIMMELFQIVYSKSLNPLKSGLLFWYRFFYSSKCERRVSIPSNRVFSSDWAWPPTILVAPVVSIPSNRVFSSDRARNPVFCDAGWVSIPSNRVFSSDMETIKINGEDVRSQSPQIGSSLLIKFIHFKSV